MLRVVLDTSVVVRLLLSRPTTLAGKTLRAMREGRFIMVLAPLLIKEIEQTLKSPFLKAKHRQSEIEVEAFVSDLTSLAELTAGTLRLDIPVWRKETPTTSQSWRLPWKERRPNW